MMKGKIEKRKKTGHVILAMLMATIMAFSSHDIGPLRAEEQDVQVNVVNMKNVDIMLTKGKTKADVSLFADDIKAALKERVGFTDEQLKCMTFSQAKTEVESVSSHDENVDEIVNNWQTVGAPTWTAANGEIYSNVPGGGIIQPVWTQHPFSGHWKEGMSKSWWGTGLIDPDGFETNDLQFDFIFVNCGNLNEGVCFNVTQNDDGSLNGYFVSLGNHEQGSSNAALFRFNHYTLDQAFNSGINFNMWCGPHNHCWVVGQTYTYGSDSYTPLATWGNSDNSQYSIKCKDGHISIKRNGSSVVELDDSTYTHGTYGFWGNNCETASSEHISSIKITKTVTIYQKYKTVLTEQQNNLRPDAMHIFVDVRDNDTESSFHATDPDYYDVLNMVNAANAYLVGWGTSATKSIVENYISMLPTGGTFCDMGTYDSKTKQMSNYKACVNETADYIASLLNFNNSSDVVICDEPTSITITPDTARANKSWGFAHDNTRLTDNMPLANSTGVSAYNKVSGITFPEDFTFDKPGLYTIYYNKKVVKTVTAHRRPAAGITIKGRTATSSTSTIFNYTFVSTSYDLDNTTDTGLGDGIAHISWSTKENDGDVTELTTAKDKKEAVIPIDVTKNTTVYITATDTMGAESTSSITINASARPVASFTVNKTPIRQDEAISLTDNSYDPMQRAITQRTWTVTDSEGKVYYTASGTDTATVIPSFKPYEKGMKNGTYTISLQVRNDNNTDSYKYKQSLDVRKYYITYSANGGTNAPERGEADYKDTYTITSAVPTKAQGQATKTVNIDLQGGTLSGKTGTVKQNAVFPITYTLDHWTGSDGKSYKAGQTLTITGDMTMQAGWKGTIEKGTFVSATPTKARYKFLGYGKTPGDSTSAVTYKAGGAVSYNDITEGETFFAIWTGKKFIGWNTKADGSGTWYKSGDGAPQANLDLYAQWEFPES